MTALNLTANTSRILPSIEDYEYSEFLKDDVLVVGYLIILCIIGTIGNGHAIVVYYLSYKPSNHRTFVLWLAAVDFLACAVCIPFEIVDIRHGFTFGSSAACKVFRYLNHIANIGSGCLYGVIAIERYRKACCPFGRQMTERESFISCMVTVGMSMLVSLPSFYIYEAAIKLTSIVGLAGMDCTVGSTKSQKQFFKFYSGFLLLLSTVVFIICIVVYSLVGKALYKQMNFRRSVQTTNKQHKKVTAVTSDLSNGSSLNQKLSEELAGKDNRQETPVKPAIQSEESSVCLDSHRKVQFAVSNNSTISVSSSNKRPSKLDRTKRITLMFLVATAVAYIGIIPNIIILIIRGVKESAYRHIALKLGIFTPVLLRGYFLSNVTNPVVYCFVDDRFRKECNKLYGNIKTALTKRNSRTLV